MDGKGARLVGGRCNDIGVSAVYAAEHASLALVEVLVHVDRSEVPGDYVLMGIRVPNKRFPESSPEAAKQISHLRAEPFLRVRSVVVPRELNYVLYPEATNFEAAVEFIEPFEFDTRLFVRTRIV